jgi:hypothetical protein
VINALGVASTIATGVTAVAVGINKAIGAVNAIGSTPAPAPVPAPVATAGGSNISSSMMLLALAVGGAYLILD